jgi:sortase A
MYKYFRRHATKLTAIVIVLLFATSLWQLAAAAWIQGKAVIAQQLLIHAWNQTVADAQQGNIERDETNRSSHKPWPWADTWPVAKLIAPQHGIEQIVLAGDSGNSLAFGPGYAFASALPNSSGLTMISGHRDTHFAFLKDLKPGDRLDLQTAENIMHYRVDDFQIVDSRTFSLAADSDEQSLLLVTCYPFDAIAPGGPLRYLVYAKNNLSK